VKSREVVLGLIFVLILWIPSLYIIHKVGAFPGLHFWLHTLAGGWPETDIGHPKTSVEYSFAVTLALLLHLSPIVLLVELVVLVVRGTTEKAMNLAQTLSLRDRSIKNNLLILFPDGMKDQMRNKIDEAFREGNTAWRDHLVTIFGENGAEKVTKRLEESEIK
jgi:hypothetical protein